MSAFLVPHEALQLHSDTGVFQITADDLTCASSWCRWRSAHAQHQFVCGTSASPQRRRSGGLRPPRERRQNPRLGWNPGLQAHSDVTVMAQWCHSDQTHPSSESCSSRLPASFRNHQHELSEWPNLRPEPQPELAGWLHSVSALRQVARDRCSSQRCRLQPCRCRPQGPRSQSKAHHACFQRSVHPERRVQRCWLVPSLCRGVRNLSNVHTRTTPESL